MDSTLTHHGIKGQKWGVRRFQNRDGTLTSAGKKRYGDDDGSTKTLTEKGAMRRLKTDSSGTTSSASKSSSGKKSVKDMSDADLTNQVKRLNLEKQYKKLSKEDAGPSKLESAKRAVDSASGLVNQAKNMNRSGSKKIRPDLSKMSDKDLRDLITRENLERQYTDLFGKDAATVSRGKKIFDNVLEYGGGVLAVGSSALGIAMAIKELRK